MESEECPMSSAIIAHEQMKDTHFSKEVMKTSEKFREN
jgi:hypothetical protein